MKKMINPIVIAFSYILIVAMLFAIDSYYLKPSMFDNVGKNFELTHTFDMWRSIVNLVIIPIAALIGTLHTLMLLPILSRLKKSIIVTSLMIGGIVVPCWMYFASLNSPDGLMIWTGTIVFSCGAFCLTVALCVLLLALHKVCKGVKSGHQIP